MITSRVNMIAWPADNGIGRLPDLIQVRQRRVTGDDWDGYTWQLTIDGHTFPYHLLPDAAVPITPYKTASLGVSLYADAIQIDNDPRFHQDLDGKPQPQHIESPSRWNIPTSPDPTPPADPARWPELSPRMAGLVQVRRIGSGRSWWELLVDGQAFPYRLGPTCTVPVTVMDDPDFMPRMHITLLARRIELDLEGPVGGNGSAVSAASGRLSRATAELARAQADLDDARRAAATFAQTAGEQ
ncbi:hypothetical protein [Nonomuraea sp. NPDC005650]|uniref:hypothetical protein n=1 Tax=Nonomuraea sp. NPDC005650 TaxID=3157045 RepID=UPI0033AB5928